MTKNKMFKNVAFLGLAAVAGMSLASCGEKDDATTYTYNGFYDGNILNWSPLNWETNADGIIEGYTTDGLYTFDFNDDRTSYKVSKAMASDFPVDVTSTYAGQYQVPEGATASYAYRIKLNDKCKFQDGRQITADDYIESYKRLIDTSVFNYRSSTYESGQLVISGSAYYKNKGKTEDTSLNDVAKYDHSSVEEYYEAHKTDKAMVNWLSVGYVLTKTEDGYAYAKATSDDNKTVDSGFTLEEFKTMMDTWWEEDYAEYALIPYTYKDASFEDTVGLKKIDDYTIDIVSDTAISTFYMEYNLNSTWLVDTKLYDNTLVKSGSTSTTTYGTSPETTNSYGPYKLVEYIDNKQFRLEKNENWYGYSDPANEGYYQTTNIFYQRIDESSTQLQSFLKGNLDEVTLNADTVSDYLGTDYLLPTPQTFTMEFFMNSNKEKLEALDAKGDTKYNVLLAYSDFRKAMSMSINRTEFASTVSAGCEAAAMLYNNLYISDPDNGTVYRLTEQAKQAFKDTYAGATTVEGTYKPDEATTLLKSVYDEAVAAGDYKAGADIKFIIACTSTASQYQAVATYLTTSLNAILTKTNTDKGTNYGKITVELNGSDGSKRYDNLLAGKYSMMFGAWGGNSLAPHSFIQVYLEPNYNYCPGFDSQSMSFTYKMSDMETEQTHTYYDWYLMLNAKSVADGGYADAIADLRNELLAAIESNFLREYTIIPMYALTDFELVSKKIKMGTDEYVTVMGFGGIKYMTYNYSDQEWADYIAKNSSSGQLDYTE